MNLAGTQSKHWNTLDLILGLAQPDTCILYGWYWGGPAESRNILDFSTNIICIVFEDKKKHMMKEKIRR